jgi:hypothetical protein
MGVAAQANTNGMITVLHSVLADPQCGLAGMVRVGQCTLMYPCDVCWPGCGISSIVSLGWGVWDTLSVLVATSCRSMIAVRSADL